MSASPAVRSLRAAVFAAVCVLLAAAGHGLAMGDMPSVGADAGAFLGVFGLGWALGRRERSLPGIGAVMLATQAGLHFAFGAAHPGPAAGSGRAHVMHMAAMIGHGMTGHGMTGHVMTGHGMAAMHARSATVHATTAHATTAYATLAHLLAALLASWWLRRGEAALWSLLRRAVALVPGLIAWWRNAPLPDPTGRTAPLPAAPEPPRRPALRHAVSRRGPPRPIPYTV
ncbi:hypothetical protein PV343_08350 [Streptomyces sp. WI03-4A]|uniref:hypothetical protein n=1 Tax=Streptomyces sp. WI03-4A TaxID=3028706 RepID=UPI0029B83D2D|nr:hypothetical protein [Streptomyces sp. WI03-4A]MDX2592271.1 hypothetical protein [Streptomyces sp. WI03-4A]